MKINNPRQTELLWKHYLTTRATKDRNRLVEHYASLVYSKAAGIKNSLPQEVQYEELVSAGFDGLIQAVTKYDQSRNIKFETYSKQRINGAMRDWLRDIDLQSRFIRAFERRQKTTIDVLVIDEFTADPETIARSMNLPIDKYKEYETLSRLGNIIPISVLTGDHIHANKSRANAEEIIDLKSYDPVDHLARKTIKEFITRGLTRDERLVLVLYYYENLTMKEIGLVIDLSRSRISQIHTRIIKRLRDQKNIEKMLRE